jgi:NitT/TauT family transport system substrate-binding protein
VPSIEPVLIIQPRGVKAKIFYTAYQCFGYGIVVPTDSPIKDFADLKGKTIGVTLMASAGIVVARAQLVMAGIAPMTQARRRGRGGSADGGAAAGADGALGLGLRRDEMGPEQHDQFQQLY